MASIALVALQTSMTFSLIIRTVSRRPSAMSS
jgi:hypothetical protein